jgi:hypothetical protein
LRRNHEVPSRQFGGIEEMVKKLLILCVSLILVGCQTTPTPNTVYKDVKIPSYIVPKPPKIERPQLAIETITPEQQKEQGELVKAYTLTIKQLEQYVVGLEKIITRYDEVSGEHDTKPDLMLVPSASTP